MVSKSAVARRVGSSPTPGTIIKTLFSQQVNVADAALCLLSTAVENQNFVQRVSTMANIQKITGKRGSSYRVQFMKNGRRIGQTFKTKKAAERLWHRSLFTMTWPML